MVHTHTKEQDTNELKNLKTRWFQVNFFLRKNESLLKTMLVSQYEHLSHNKCCNFNSVKLSEILLITVQLPSVFPLFPRPDLQNNNQI